MRHRIIYAVWLILVFASSSAGQSTTRRVLIMHSFERAYAADAGVADVFRTELSALWPDPIDFFEVSLQPTPNADVVDESSVVNYLRSSLGGQRLDLVVTLSAPAAVFVRKYRHELFPRTPLLMTSVDRRWLDDATFAGDETAVTIAIDPQQVIEGILGLLPDTANVFVVVGTSRLEQAWRAELVRAFQPFGNRLTFTWLNELSFAEMLTRSATLPAHSVIFYVFLSVDAKGFSHTESQALAELHRVANAPIFGLASTQLGLGIIGGRLYSIDEAGRNTANAALRILRGESPGHIKTPPLSYGRPTYDWRELHRWGISDARLATGSIVLFRQPGLWDQYKSYVIGTALVVGLQSALIAGLLVQRVRRRRTERALRESERHLRQSSDRNRDLAGRLINAQEAERTRIARDLHDDVSQQLAGVSIAFSGLKQRLNAYQVSEEVRQELVDLQRQTHTLGRNVRQLSHDLHPAVLQHLGLVKGLTSYCGELGRAHGVAVTCTAEGDFRAITPDAALCLYRITQEALRNVIAHAGASRAEVKLLRMGDHAQITIADDGRGFDASNRVERDAGLGVVSMSERARMMGGSVSIVSGPDQGTTVQATIPMNIGVTVDAGSGMEGQVA